MLALAADPVVDLHVWLTGQEDRHGSLMVLLAYMILGHPDWRDPQLKIFAADPRTETPEARSRLEEFTTTGRIPVSPKNFRIIPTGARSAGRGP